MTCSFRMKNQDRELYTQFEKGFVVTSCDRRGSTICYRKRMTTDPFAIVRRGEGTPILFIHGSGVDHRLLLPLDEALDDDRRWERIYIDLPGFGGTPPLAAPGGLPELVDWVDNFVIEEFGARKFAIIANSLGGFIARELVARHISQIVAIALIAPVVDPRADHRNLPHREILEENPEFLKSLSPEDASAFSEMAVVQNAENWEKFHKNALPGIRSADPHALTRLESGYEIEGPLPEQRFGRFEGPTLILSGRQDHVVGFEDQIALSASYPRATIAVLDRAGHNVHLDQPAVVSTLLRTWQSEAAKKI